MAESPLSAPPRASTCLAGQVVWVVLLGVAGCSHWHPAAEVELPPAVAEPALADRVRAPVPPEEDPDKVVVPSAPATATQESALTLSEAITFALENNPRLAGATAEIERSAGLEEVAFAPFLPQLGLLTRYVITSSNLGPGAPGPTGGVEPENLVDTHNFGQVELQLQWLLCDFGRRASRHGQAIAREQIARLRRDRARQTVALDVCTGYLQVLLTSALRMVQTDAIRAAEATLRDSRARRAAGAAERDDVLRAEVQLSETREAMVRAREAELAALARLNNALGRNASRPLRVVDWRAQPAFRLSLAECLETAAARRPEVDVVRQEVASAALGSTAAEAEYWPRVYLRGSLGEVNGANVLEGTQSGFALHIDYGVYEGGRRRGEQKAAAAEVEAAVASAQAVLDGISLEVTLAHRALTAARRRIELSEPAIAQATENLRLVRVKYRNGNATPTDLVDSETTLTRSRQRYYVAVYEYLSALARLEYALGGAPGALLRACFDPPAVK